jgi:hypothetical protein
MNTTVNMERAAARPKVRGAKTIGGADLGQAQGAAARRIAAAILEVLAGARTPSEAATALGLSVPRYYQVETQALRGLLAACEPKPQGRRRSPDSGLATLRRENQRLQREVGRQQALVRAAQRAVGLAPPKSAPATKAGKKPRRPRVARALRVAARLQPEAVPKTPTPAPPTTVAAL